MTHQQWESREPFEIKGGRLVYPVYAVGAFGNLHSGGTIYVHDTEIPPEEVEASASVKRRLGKLLWVNDRGPVVEYTTTDEEWQGRGIARGMWNLARSKDIAPSLRHAPCTSRNENGERFVRAVSPCEACRGECTPDCRDWPSQIGMPGEDGPRAAEGGARQSVRPLGMWARIRGFFGS